ncbi:cyclic nucleotide-binding domain-containing protein [Flammeovirga sp. EKP202]|uniref:cyclic nucleotide-binding domain-containing protein n=1 Tax=Flammeovirga sp. EKP202 TaxID=2770592 RepID=UPI00165F4D7A|nr:cyclic nucleotide-binding domain-containing protein [Flammeovirga sp. EKP202]MBD0404105.1 Crp/Fnr family transcriptional regulator [Flammeovirga sp. EKP202]
MYQFITHCSEYIPITIADVAVINKIFLTQKALQSNYLLQNEKHNRCFYYIEKGSVRLVSKSSDLEEEYFFQKGDFFSTYHFLKSKSQIFDIIFLEDVQYIEISLEHLLKLCEYDRKFKKLPEIMFFKGKRIFQDFKSE